MTSSVSPNHCYTDCSMWLKNDIVYEGVESLHLELDRSPQDPRVRIIEGKHEATIYIHDSDDGTYVRCCTPLDSIRTDTNVISCLKQHLKSGCSLANCAL